ncbi:MAG: haloacid dehalogenase-like hydrolase, partial [Spirochaetales bacterium]|nr:haloacid dehalogenase-like hydrolase [Spirochaetales bacterium]
DAEYRDLASDFEKEVAEKIVTMSQTSSPVGGLDMDHGIALSTAFRGMTPEEFDAYVQGFKQTSMPHYTGMNRGDGFYLPMLQVIEYLQANDFLVYIVSGSDRFMVRAIINGSPVDLPPRQIIGSDMRTVATNQGEEEGLKYTFGSTDEVLLSGDFVIKNLKMNKVSVIVQEIGQQPVLSFGNSTGDAAMANYVITDNPYRSLAFMLCCDDTERENGNPKKADEMKALCAENNWVPVSMKNDWTTIYGDSVKYTK